MCCMHVFILVPRGVKGQPSEQRSERATLIGNDGPTPHGGVGMRLSFNFREWK